MCDSCGFLQRHMIDCSRFYLHFVCTVNKPNVKVHCSPSSDSGVFFLPLRQLRLKSGALNRFTTQMYHIHFAIASTSDKSLHCSFFALTNPKSEHFVIIDERKWPMDAFMCGSYTHGYMFVCHLRNKSPASLSWPFARCIFEPNQTAKPNHRLNMCFHFESRTYRKVRKRMSENLSIFHIWSVVCTAICCCILCEVLIQNVIVSPIVFLHLN